MFSVRVHRKVIKFLQSIEPSQKEQCKKSIDLIVENPFVSRSGCDIKKLSGQKQVYRLRVGDYRFVYIVDGNEVYLMEAFRRGKGY